ncbi:MAG TPA: molybdopterin oxidoreductase [Deltaproteobacteria bacterium]|nr:MAG: molybdopterin oxidoreductase [Deltaproteobacteria bacterium GWA2_45_12]HBF14027.1 molybdopterin oxidoreductase [Deltaproteobacteria bacterium]
MGSIDRRSFLKMALQGGAGLLWLTGCGSQVSEVFQFLQPFDHDNPLKGYPSRDWEKVYRDLFHYDSTFNFLCAPNDTHNCLLTTYVKNGVAVRIGPSFGFGKATDVYGNKSSNRWDPRCCQKGLALIRRFYGDRRCKEPMVRQGFFDWAKSGFERDPSTGAMPKKYLNRGKDAWVKVSWEEAWDLQAQVMQNIATTYSGDAGKQYLTAQGYDPAMVEAVEGAGVQTLKFRGGMAALGATRIFAQYRLANSLALLDSKIRNVGPDKSIGARGWDNYSWHTDLPPGHPMVTGQQTVDWDLALAERADVLICWGMNWITTKMPDAHWLTEARLKGTKVIVIAAEYSATSSKADLAVVVRPGTTPALALGLSYPILKQKKYNPEYLRAYTDLPLLVRMDTLELLKAKDVISHYQNSSPSNYVQILKEGEKAPKPLQQKSPLVSEKLQDTWGDCMVWDEKTQKSVPLVRDDYGKKYAEKNIQAALEGSFTATLLDGKKVEVRPNFDLLQKYVFENYDPQTTSGITWAPIEAIQSIANDLAEHKGKSLFAMGMGPNQYFNSDLKDRAVFFLAALTENIGKVGGNVGSYAGNYRGAFFSGLGQFTLEDPFNINLDASALAQLKPYFKAESVHYFNHGDTVLRMGKELLTGKTHIPTPTKAIHVSNSNSLIGNAKGHYETVMNVLPRVEFIAVNEWWWTASCEYADIVYPVDSWAELKHPDMTISVTNPFLYIFPRTPLPRIYNTLGDIEVAAGLGKAFAKLTGDQRFDDYWKFVNKNKTDVYLQRIISTSNSTKGYDIHDLEEKAKQGVPALLMSRTYPKVGAWEQANEDKPYYTKTGRLEFYRDEKEFLDSGENMPVYREPIDSTFYEPNVIVSKTHPALRPKQPSDYGVENSDLRADTRQARHIVKPWSEVALTSHPLKREGFNYIFHTPKYRHGAHTTPIDTDIIAVWFGPFGDMHREDKRMPYVTEAYMDINPLDAKELGIEDGDYVYVDADPHDRPYKGWKAGTEEYKLARLLCRARYYPGTPRKVTRMWHNMYGATFGSMKGAETRTDALAKNPDTGYQSLFRAGSHQSCTRGWLKPTWMTDSLVRKNLFGQQIGKGFEPDVHCPTGAPREAFVKITKAEDGGMNGQRLWKHAAGKLRPTYESAEMKKFLVGGYAKKK